MMCYPPSGYIIFSLRKLKLYGGRGPDVRTGAGGQTTQTPVNFIFQCFTLSLSLSLSLFFCMSTKITCRYDNILCVGGMKVKNRVMTGLIIIPKYYAFFF